MDYRTWPARAARTVTAVAAAITISVGAASAAAAVTTDYHPTQESRDFATSDGGWIDSTAFEGLPCPVPVLGLTCPVVTNEHVTTDGAGGTGDGFIRTEVQLTLLSVLNTTAATWTSPTFTYDGAGGHTPDSVTLTLDRRVNAGALLALLNNPRYRVVLRQRERLVQPGPSQPFHHQPDELGRRRSGRRPRPPHHR